MTALCQACHREADGKGDTRLVDYTDPLSLVQMHPSCAAEHFRTVAQRLQTELNLAHAFASGIRKAEILELPDPTQWLKIILSTDSPAMQEEAVKMLIDDVRRKVRSHACKMVQQAMNLIGEN